ncbi:MAG: lipoyl synthase [Fibrobacterota bacterium]
MAAPLARPAWLKKRVAHSPEKSRVEALLEQEGLHTVCQGAGCPNRCECFGRGTATFMILGDVCTRQCRFCGVAKGAPRPVDAGEPGRVATAVRALGLSHAVITSVTRDDLPDRGAAHFAETVRAVRTQNPATTVEILVPDFLGDLSALKRFTGTARPDVFNHNLETVPRLYTQVRPGADYARSLALLAAAKKRLHGTLVKSGLMVGLGETEDEIFSVLDDLATLGCDLVTVGQYLAPSRNHLPVAAYVDEAAFSRIREYALMKGIREAFCGPFVRSSYKAETLVKEAVSFKQVVPIV